MSDVIAWMCFVEVTVALAIVLVMYFRGYRWVKPVVSQESSTEPPIAPTNAQSSAFVVHTPSPTEPFDAELLRIELEMDKIEDEMEYVGVPLSRREELRKKYDTLMSSFVTRAVELSNASGSL
jgi:hypothetical protein